MADEQRKSRPHVQAKGYKHRHHFSEGRRLEASCRALFQELDIGLPRGSVLSRLVDSSTERYGNKVLSVTHRCKSRAMFKSIFDSGNVAVLGNCGSLTSLRTKVHITITVYLRDEEGRARSVPLLYPTDTTHLLSLRQKKKTFSEVLFESRSVGYEIVHQAPYTTN